MTLAFRILLLALASSLSAIAQTTPAPACANLPYNYFAESGVTFGQAKSTTSGFGMRMGCSNAFLTTDIDSTIGAPVSAYSTLRAGVEYVAASSGLWSLTAFAAAGATTAGGVSFAGGGGVQFDLGRWVSKGKFSLLSSAQMRVAGAPEGPANAVTKSLSFLFRKTF